MLAVGCVIRRAPGSQPTTTRRAPHAHRRRWHIRPRRRHRSALRSRLRRASRGVGAAQAPVSRAGRRGWRGKRSLVLTSESRREPAGRRLRIPGACAAPTPARCGRLPFEAFRPEKACWPQIRRAAPVLHRSRVLTQKAFGPYNRSLFSPWQPGKEDRVAAERVGVPGRSTETHEVDRGAKEWSVRRAGGLSTGA